MDLTGLVVIGISAVLGWRISTIGLREIKGMALVVAGWTAVETVAMVPYLSLEFLVRNLANHAALVCIPFAVAVGIRRLQKPSR